MSYLSFIVAHIISNCNCFYFRQIYEQNCGFCHKLCLSCPLFGSIAEKYLNKIVKTMRIVWCFTIVIAIVFLALGINSLVTAGPFFENESEALLPKSGAIAMTVIGGVCAMITFFLTFFSFVVPAMAKFAPKINGVLLDANKDNIRTVVRTIGEASKTSSQSAPVQEDVETMFCHNCGQQIAKDSVYCKHCGAKQ